jgi:NAD(P)H-dependent flavin oxidoreductase YrpB (nitropropane dioxygenase family)
MNTLQTSLCRRLGIELPIFGFSHSIDVTVAIAESGGFPVFGVGREAPEHIGSAIDAIRRRLGSRPFGVDIMYPRLAADEPDLATAIAKIPARHKDFVASLRHKYRIPNESEPNFFSTHIRNAALFRAQTEAVLESEADAVVTAVGLPPEVIATARERGKLTFALVGSTHHVAKARAAGVDVIVAQGYDGGGHTGAVGTFTLVPQVIEAAPDVPVLAAGGIGCGRQIAAALALGAAGVWLGTAWMATTEYAAPPVLLKKLLAARSEDTTITRSHSGKPCRVLRSAWSDAWDDPSAPAPLPMPYQQALIGDVLGSIAEHQIEPLVYEAAGQSVAWFNEATTVADVIGRLIRETETAFQDLRNRALL